MAPLLEQAGESGAWKPRSALLGTLLANRYRITQSIGQGSTGAVYRADDLLMNRPVAVRILAPSLAQNPVLVSRIRARIDRNIKIQQQQPDALVNLVDAFDVGMTLEGELFIVTDFLDGDHLSAMLERGGRLPWSRARHLFIRLSQLLQALHERGIVLGTLQARHCYAVRGRPKNEAIKIVSTAVLEHIAANLGPGAGAAGAQMARYAAPEQGCGEPIDIRTDVYSFGVIAYELLTGRVPFSDTNPIRVVAQHLHATPMPLRQAAPDADIPAAVEEVILKALAKAPDGRHPSMEAFTAALLAIPENEAAAAVAPAPAPEPVTAAAPPPPPPAPAPTFAAPAPSTAPAKPLASTLPVSSDTLSAPAPSVSPAAAAAAAAMPEPTPTAPGTAPAKPAVVMRVVDAPPPPPSAPPPAPASIAPPPPVGPRRPPSISMPTLIPSQRRPSEPLAAAHATTVLSEATPTAPAEPPVEKPALALAPIAAPAPEPAPAPASAPEPAPAPAPVPTSDLSPAVITALAPAPSDRPQETASPVTADPAPAEPVRAPAPAEPVRAPAPADSIRAPIPADSVRAPAAADSSQARQPAASESMRAPAPADSARARPSAGDSMRAPAPADSARAAAPAEITAAVSAVSAVPPPEEEAPSSWTAARRAAVDVNPEALRAAALKQSAERHPSLGSSAELRPSESIIAELPKRRTPWFAIVGLGAALAAGFAAYVQTEPELAPPNGRAAVPPTKTVAPPPTPKVEAKPPPVVAETPPPPPDPIVAAPPQPALVAEPADPKDSEEPAPAETKKKKKKRRSPAEPEEEEEDLFDQVRKHMEAKKAAEAGNLPPPAPTPTPTPASEPGSTPKPVDDNASKAKDTLDRARQAAAQGNHPLAYSLAKQANSLARSQEALELMGLSACKAGNADNARSAADQLSGSRRSAVVSACAGNGITL